MEMDNNQKLNDLFNQARNEAPQVSFTETKEQFTKSVNQLSPSSSTETPHLFTTKTWTIMVITLITSIGIGAYLLIPTPPNNQFTIPVRNMK